MTTITIHERLPYSCEQIYQLVNDIEAYPQFLQWCAEGKILEQTENMMLAQLTVTKGPFKQSFQTRNSLQAYSSIRLTLEEGPFASFNGQWDFQPTKEGHCNVSFTLSFSFDNKFLAMTIGPIFQNIGQGIVAAFKVRAETVYG
jgi:ribosome-associated toxin RatA of RatAB toxin-antitoxin module